ncbi:MAG: type I restriction-modification system subunit M N-terminal domain-containing protein [Planctomycetales bacterium]|nr:type I restriction-modification system subunit M N-terminal domain-containing protein [Planctomycetales bacterium]
MRGGMDASQYKDYVLFMLFIKYVSDKYDANSRLARSDFPDFNDSNKLGDGAQKAEKLGNLIAISENPALDFSQNRAGNSGKFPFQVKVKLVLPTVTEVPKKILAELGVNPAVGRCDNCVDEDLAEDLIAGMLALAR